METRRFFLAALSAIVLNVSAANAKEPSPSGYPKKVSVNSIRFPRINHKWPFPTGSGWLSLQTQMLYTAYPDYGRSFGLPPLQLSFDYSFDPHVSIGGYLGRYRTDIFDNFGNEPYKTSFWSNSGGIRVTVHFADMLNAYAGSSIDLKKWDVYATGSLGWYTRNFSTVSERYRNNRDYSFGSYSRPGLVAGIRYFPIEDLAVFAEGGWGAVSVFGIGLSGRILK